MINNLTDLSELEMLSTIGGLNDKAVLHTVGGAAALITSIALGQPVGVVYSCFEIGYHMTRIFD